MKHPSDNIVHASPGNCSPVSNSSTSVITYSYSKWMKCDTSGYINFTSFCHKSFKSFLISQELRTFRWLGWKPCTHLESLSHAEELYFICFNTWHQKWTLSVKHMNVYIKVYIYIYIYIYIYTSLYVYTCMHLWVYLCITVWRQTCIYVSMHISIQRYTAIHIDVCVNIYFHNVCLCTYRHTHTHAHECLPHTCIYMYTYIHVCLQNTYMDKYIFIQVGPTSVGFLGAWKSVWLISNLAYLH